MKLPRWWALVVTIASPAGAATTVNISPSRDTTLFQSSGGSLANGAGSAMFVGTNSQSNVRRALLWFDIAANVPAGATITSLELRLHNSSANSDGVQVSLHRALESWGEGASIAGGSQGGGTAPAPGDATWLHRFYNGTLWSAPGGVFDAMPSAAAVIGGAGHWTWASTPTLVADAQSFLDSPASNFGWELIGGENTASTARRFATRQEPDVSLRPVLTVTFVPSPGALSLAGALALSRRRRAPATRRGALPGGAS